MFGAAGRQPIGAPAAGNSCIHKASSETSKQIFHRQLILKHSVEQEVKCGLKKCTSIPRFCST
uniref:G-patch domain containing 2 n=1 Tax=Molossus molossus TaxID=27622 RepID=A0A7J8BMV8_MOLMO|nr:G-patch domain containing 2 [Molossus molossus]